MMDYNNYYPVQHGQQHISSNMMSIQPDCSPMRGQMMTPNGPQMMQPSPAPSTPHSMQQTPSPMPTQQHMGPGSQMHSHQQPSPHHSNYHQLPQQPPISHSASPHPSSTPQQPPPRPSTGPSPLHHQSPIHMNGPSPKSHSINSLGPPQLQNTNWGPQQHSNMSSISFSHQNSHLSQSHNYMNGPMQTQTNVQQYGHTSMFPHQQQGPPHPSPQMHQHSNHIHNVSPVHHQSSMMSRGMISPHIHQHVPSNQHHQQHQHHQQQQQQHEQQQSHHIAIQHQQQPCSIEAGHTSPLERGSPFYQQIPQTEFRIIKLNKRLQNRPRRAGPPRTLPVEGIDESAWWRRFACDFFDDDAILSLQIPSEDKPSEYNIGRVMIPRFFKSYFDGGVTDFSIKLRNIRETAYKPGFVTLDCDQTDITTKNYLKPPGQDSPVSVIVHTEGHLRVEFASSTSENLLIKSWKFYANQCHEYVDRSMISTSRANTCLVEPVTRFGLTKNTFSFLKMCMIMEPMQDLMTQHRQTNMEPRACLKQLLFDRFKLKSVEETKSQPPRRRRRKAATESGTDASAAKKTKANNASQDARVKIDQTHSTNEPIESNNPLASQDVLVVGEPMLGADFGDENERRATRLENSQYDPKAFLDLHENAIAAQQQQQQPKQQGTTKSAEKVEIDQQIVESAKDERNPNLVQQQEKKFVPDKSSLAKPSVGESNQKTLELKEKSTKFLEPCNKDPFLIPNQCKETERVDRKSDSKCNSINSESNSNLPVNNKEAAAPGPTNEAVHTNEVACPDEPPRLVLEGPAGKENNNEEVPATHTTDSTKSVATINSTKTVGIVPSNKQNRRRSSERKETTREGLMRTSDFVVAMKDLKLEHPPLWRITTGNNLLQQFEPKTQNGVILFENTNQYAGWNPEIRKDYVGVDVRLTQHTRNQITVERLMLNFQKIEDADTFHDRHFAIYLQILISTALDPKFWDGIENELKYHDYFITSRRIVEEIIKRYKMKITSRLKLGEHSLKEFEKYPSLIIKPVEGSQEKLLSCRACNSNQSTHQVTFENRSYDLHTFKPVKVTSENKNSKDQSNLNLCGDCLELVRMFSDIHHLGWRFFNIARERAEQLRSKGKPMNIILDECLKDDTWMTKIFAERDSIWSKVDQIQ